MLSCAFGKEAVGGVEGGRRGGKEVDINQPGSTAGTSTALIMDEIKDHSAAQTEEG